MWERLCGLLGIEELTEDPRFRTNEDRCKNRSALTEILENRLQAKTSGEWIEEINAVGVACGPIYAVDQVFEDEQVRHQKMLYEADHPTAGKIKSIGFPMKFHKTPCEQTLPPPLHGQHTDEILQSLGYSEEEIGALRERGVI